MALIKPAAQPGFMSQATQVQAAGAWYDGNLVRWRNSFLEKWAGWRRLVIEAFPSTIRRMHAWLDLDNRKNLLVAGDFGVDILVQDTVYKMGRQLALKGGYIVEIGPDPESTKFSVTLGSTEVTVQTTVFVTAGDTFFTRLPISVGGRTILAGAPFVIKAVTTGIIGFTFDMLLPALVTETGTYGIPLLNNNIVNAMTVTWKAHGFGVGAKIRFAQGTTVKAGALNVWEKVNFSVSADTVLTVDTVPDADHFTFKMGGLGTGDGAGTTAQQVYLGCSVVHTTGSLIDSSIGTVIGIVVVAPLGNPQSHTWFLGNLGQDGLVLATGGPLQVYRPPIENGSFLAPVGAGSPAIAPQRSNGMIVAMPQAQVILFGCEIPDKNLATGEAMWGGGVVDPLLICWSDVGTYSVWSAKVTNQAGNFRLSRGSKIIGAIQAPQTTYIFTDTDIWSMSYIGPPLIYGFTIIGTGCGLIAPHAVGGLGRATVWQGQKNFWQVGDTGVQPLPCSVWDYIFNDLDGANLIKCHAAPNSTTTEIGFYFPSRRTMVTESGNLLLFSQLFSDPSWIISGAAAIKIITFKVLYVYEPQYANIALYDDMGIPPISWFDSDVQGVRENSEATPFAPDGSDTAFNLVELFVDGTHSISQKIEKVGAQIMYTFSLYVHDNATRNITLRAVSKLGSAFATFDPIGGHAIATGVTSPRFAFIRAEVLTDRLASDRIPGGNGWRRFVMAFVSDDSSELELFINLTDGTLLSYPGSLTHGALIWGAQLVFGTNPLDYQPTTGELKQNEANRYAKVNLAEGGAWDSGQLKRSSWIDNSIWGTPLGADEEHFVQQHERGFDADGDAMSGVFAETGFAELGDGTVMLSIDQVHPDLKWFGRDGGVKISLRATNYAQGQTHLYGPYSMTPTTQYFTPRVRARYVAVRYDWEPLKGFSARIGATTFKLKPAGRRP